MTYRERRAARAERLREWAQKREVNAQASVARFDHYRGDIAFATQPGHIPERTRMIRAQERAFASLDKAGEMRSRAAGIEDQADRAIYSDDPDAIDRLRQKIAALETEREQMVAANAEYRRTHKAELKAATSTYQRSLLVPYPGYALQNLGGNITRLRKRLESLSGQPRAAAGAVAVGDTAAARAGLIVTASMTTPSRPGKAPRPVWVVSGALAEWRQFLIDLGGRWYGGAFSFFDDPAEDIERACAEARG